ncbi:hypothetical protein E2C01_073736 [Portunus trituberculatus]|uniref:Uncharacterized protein n=1 Tax=Portunus trituberculatus TaxID=210409 RepID=A0A5B7I3S8_PORTR|nr:hypothetical protein [Portunus trituberculatus]
MHRSVFSRLPPRPPVSSSLLAAFTTLHLPPATSSWRN